MDCPKCGKQIPDDSSFCAHCGAQVVQLAQEPAGTMQAEPSTSRPFTMEVPTQAAIVETPRNTPVPEPGSVNPPPKAPPGIKLGQDGVYRWFYSFDMLKNPTLLYTIWKVLAIAVGAVYLLVLLMDLGSGSIESIEDFWQFSKVFIFILAGFLAAGGIAYLILAGIYGWRYQVIFEMDEKGVTHRQMPAQFQIAEALSLIELLAAEGPTGAGAAILAGSKSESSVSFSKLKSIKVLRRQQTIKVNERMEHCQVYAKPEDFDFVLNYIRERAPKGIRIR